MRAIVDTSVWIDFFLKALPPRKQSAMQSLIETGGVVLTDVIRFELLSGARNDSDFRKLEEMLSPLDMVRINDRLIEKFSGFGYDLNKRGLLGRYTDVSIAFLARCYRLPVFSLDRYFMKLSQHRIVKVVDPKD